MKLKNHLDYLERIGSTDITHSKRSLNDHLIGTYEILRLWGEREYVCLAGLFHSVYSTQKFTIALMNRENRFDIARRIGPRAELLVFFFSLITIENLKNAVRNRNKTSFVWNELEIELTNLQYAQLVVITIANFIEQIPYLVNGKDFDYEQYLGGWGWIKGIVSKRVLVHLKKKKLIYD